MKEKIFNSKKYKKSSLIFLFLKYIEFTGAKSRSFSFLGSQLCLETFGFNWFIRACERIYVNHKSVPGPRSPQTQTKSHKLKHDEELSLGRSWNILQEISIVQIDLPIYIFFDHQFFKRPTHLSSEHAVAVCCFLRWV